MNKIEGTQVIEVEVIESKKIEEVKKINCTKNFLTILTIPTILFLSVIAAYLGLVQINMEFHSVIIIGVIYIIFSFFIKHNAYYVVCSFENKKQILIQDVNIYIESNLIQLMGKDKAIGSIDKFFSRFAKKLRNDNYAAVAASTFPTLGILGTFISIAISMPNFGVGSSDALNNEITKLLGGVGTAFYASIYGIFLSLWWIFFEKKGFTFIQDEIRDVKDMFEERIWSDEELKRAGFVEQQSLNSELQNTIKQSLSPEFITKMNETITMQTTLLVELLQEDKALHEELRDTYKTVVENFCEITDKQNSVSTKLDQSIEIANQSYTNLSENVGKLESLSETFKLTYEAFSTQNESSKEIAQALGEVSISLSQETKAIVGSLEGVTSNLANSQNIMGDMTDKMLGMTSGISALFEGLTETTNKQNIVSEKLDKSIHMANQSYSTLSENVGKLESLSQVFQSNYDAMFSQNESSKEIAQALGEVSTSLSQETKAIVGSLEGVTSNLANSQNIMGDMTDKMLGMTSGISALFEGLTETTNKQNIVSEKLDKSIHMANQSYSTLSENVGKLESLSQVFQSNHEAITTQNVSSKEIAGILENVVVSLSKETKEIIQSFDSVSKNLADTQNTMGTMSDKLMGMSSGMQNILDGLNDTYKNTIEKQMESIKTTVASLESLYSQFHNNINSTLQSFETSAAGIKSGGDQMMNSIKGLNLQTIAESISVMSKSLHTLEGSMQNTSTSLDKSVHEFDEQFIEKLRYTFKVLDEEIGKVLSKVGTATKALVDTSGNIEDNLVDFNSELLEKLQLVLSIIPQDKEAK
jgi:methyl-accepting chemotaxis protein